MPFWLQGIIHHDEGDFDTHLGVFRRCNYLIPLTDSVAKRPATIIVRECGRYTTFWDIPGVWWQTATVTIGVGCGLSILVAFSALLCCCVRDSMSKNLARMAGVTQLVSGILIAAGCISFAAGWNNIEIKTACGQSAHSFHHGSCRISWAYFTTIGGGTALFISSGLSFFAAKRKGGYQRVAPKDKICRTEM